MRYHISGQVWDEILTIGIVSDVDEQDLPKEITYKNCHKLDESGRYNIRLSEGNGCTDILYDLGKKEVVTQVIEFKKSNSFSDVYVSNSKNTSRRTA